MKNILILSNNCISNSESNGRTHGNYLKKYDEANHIHNFYIRGNADKKSVLYISANIKTVALNKLSLGIIKANLNIEKGDLKQASTNSQKSSKSSYVFFHLIRNFIYNNRHIINNLKKYIFKNNINAIEIWGSNIPFLYKYGWKLSKLCNIPLIIFTCEDYPLKKYNYIGHKSIFFKYFQRKLFKQAKLAYAQSALNIYASDDLLEAYSEKLKTKNDKVLLFPSSVTKMENIKNDNFIIFYGGNLYSGRCQSLLEVSNALKNTNCIINVFGNGIKADIDKLKNNKNINYCGVVPYEQLKREMEKSNLLLHVEGFSKDYINDCKYAFSSKISDYYMTGKPVFMYGPYKISGIKFAYNLCKDMTALEKNELYKLKDFIYLKTNNSFSYKKIEDLFDADKTSKCFEKLVESI